MRVAAVFTDFAGYPERKKLNTYGGIGYYRMAKPSACLTNHEVDLLGSDIDTFGDTFTENWSNIFKKYDVFWAVHFFHEQNQVAQCYFADKYKKLLIYDLDDNYLDLPESNPVYDKFFKQEKGQTYSSRNKATLSAAFSFADALTVSTEPLKERMEKHMKDAFGLEKKIYVIPNMSDLNDFNFTPAKKYKDRVVIGYQGSTSHNEDLAMILPTLKKLMQKHRNLYFEVIGAVDKEHLHGFFGDWDIKLLDRVAMLPATRIFNDYPARLAEQKWDIGIAPLIDTPFTRSKSHIKWMEYSAFKIPCVASRVYPYFMPIEGRNTIVDGETGFLCRPPEWEAKLERLIVDKKLRETIGQNAYDAIKRDWQYKDSSIQDTFERILVECKKR